MAAPMSTEPVNEAAARPATDLAAEIVERTLAHYREMFARHGDTPAGVDWNGAASQRLHFDQLMKLLPEQGAFSINDLGCGYGAFLDRLVERYVTPPEYRGYDLSADMIAAARSRFADIRTARFEVADRPLAAADYGVASGIFTLRLGRGDDECWSALVAGIDDLDRTSSRAFAFNCLTSWSDADRMKHELYYPDPCRVFEHCKRHHARNVALLHDYGLYAFTILVRKEVVAPAVAP